MRSRLVNVTTPIEVVTPVCDEVAHIGYIRAVSPWLPWGLVRKPRAGQALLEVCEGGIRDIEAEGFRLGTHYGFSLS